MPASKHAGMFGSCSPSLIPFAMDETLELGHVRGCCFGSLNGSREGWKGRENEEQSAICSQRKL